MTNFSELITFTKTEEDTYAFCMSNNLVKSLVICSHCNREIHFERGKIRHGVNERLRCSFRPCRKKCWSLCGIDI